MSFIYSMTDTWNDGGTTFTAVKMNVTDTASAAGSLLLDLQVGGATRFSVNKNGQVTIAESVLISGGNGLFAQTGARFCLSSTGYLSFATSGDATGAADVFLRRDAAGVLHQRSGATAQVLRVAYTYTDDTNRQNAAINTGSDYVEFAAETAGTGADNLDVRLTPAGTGRVRFGTHSALAAETVTGYITVKDDGGTSRKVAVVS